MGLSQRVHQYDPYREPYGDGATVTRLGRINIIHLDHPSQETIEKRVDEVIREEMQDEVYEADCPLCQEIKNLPYDVFYFGESCDGRCDA